MNKIDYVIKLILFEIFFWLWSAPVVILVLLLPPQFGAAGFGRLLRVLIGLVLVLWIFVCSSWMAAIAARRNTYQYDSPIQAVRYALNEARLYLSFLPGIGPYFAPQSKGEDSPVEPR